MDMFEYTINEAGHMMWGGVDTVELAAKYKTPLYVIDEDRVREKCRLYLDTMAECFERYLPLYASKALATVDIYRITSKEGMGTDVVSAGELYMALQAGVDKNKIFFHGNSKPDEEIAFAMKEQIGYFVVDSEDELKRVNEIAGIMGLCQKVLLRVTPGIDTHTFEAVRTGQVDSKFGVAIETGQAMQFLKKAMSLKNVTVSGLHCHIGSQIFEVRPYLDCVDTMMKFIADIRSQLGYSIGMLNLGGGFGVPYIKTDEEVDIPQNIRIISRRFHAICNEQKLEEPMILFEPGRNIVADAGITLYSVTGQKQIPEVKNYVCVDGGMTDNPRYALYRSDYRILLANRATEEGTDEYTVAGRCCESGDIIQEQVRLNNPVRGDIMAVCCTGAYNYSMSSNYNGICRPAMVLVSGGRARISIRRETYEDLMIREAYGR